MLHQGRCILWSTKGKKYIGGVSLCRGGCGFAVAEDKGTTAKLQGKAGPEDGGDGSGVKGEGCRFNLLEE